jgi:hypothetical protein
MLLKFDCAGCDSGLGLFWVGMRGVQHEIAMQL